MTSRKKDGKKKKGTGGSLDVASSIVSTSHIAATPVAMHSGLPNTILGTMGTSGGFTSSGLFELPREDLQTDETDTSLYDYQNARDTFAYCPIASCLMPPAMFVAFPEITPLPPTTQMYSPGLVSALVNSSVVPRLLGLSEPQSQLLNHVSNDTDTSLCDYMQHDVG
ncbi:hypothetical protein LSAT2_019172 [Lamellibrachia satsuma]|nr:hypothetical protein LSAT2_019172 [Lamellibrachia satsuma]